jgi:hypothetical protein
MAILQATKTSSAALLAMAGVGDGQKSATVSATYAFTTAPAANDVIQSPLIQAGSVVQDVMVVLSGFGTGSTVEVGYGDDTDYFVTSTSGVAGGVLRANAATARPLVLTTNDTIDVKINGAGATAAGTVDISVTFVPRNN